MDLGVATYSNFTALGLGIIPEVQGGTVYSLILGLEHCSFYGCVGILWSPPE